MTRFPIHDLRIFRPNRPGRARNNEDAIGCRSKPRWPSWLTAWAAKRGRNCQRMAITYIGTGNESLAGTGRDYAPATDVRRALECVWKTPTMPFWALRCPTRSTPAWAPRWWWAFFSAIASSSATSGFTLLPLARRGVAANHARPFLVAGTGRCRHIDPEQAAASSNRNGYPRVGRRAACANGSERISWRPATCL